MSGITREELKAQEKGFEQTYNDLHSLYIALRRLEIAEHYITALSHGVSIARGRLDETRYELELLRRKTESAAQ